jgi:alpha/beta hydrolase family protein
MSRALRLAATALLGLLVLAVVGFMVWALNPLGPADRALAALQSDSQVTVRQDDWLSFRPAAGQPISGLIFYPGGHVDYRSYAPLARQLAARGYYVAILPVPFNLAVLGVGRASAVIAANPEIHYWAVGGHSLGGVVAAEYAAQHPAAIQGLALVAAYPAEDLAATDLRGLEIYGSEDKVLNMDRLEAAMQLLPPGTIQEVIEGGNHGQFGDYGPQPGDGPASISTEQQQTQAVDQLARLLRTIEGK